MMRNPLAWLSEILVGITAIPILAMMLHVTLDVTLKYIFNTPIQGTLEITAFYYMVAIVVLPMGFVELTRQSISVDIFYDMFPRPMQIAVVAFVLLASAAGYGLIGVIALQDAVVAFNKREIVMGSADIAIWPARIMLPIALLLAMLVCLMHFFRMLLSPSARAELVGAHAIDPESKVD